MTPDSYSLAKINDRSRYSFFSPSLISVRSSPPWKWMENFAKIWGYGPLSSFLELLQPQGKGPIGTGGWNYSSTEKWNEQAVSSSRTQLGLRLFLQSYMCFECMLKSLFCWVQRHIFCPDPWCFNQSSQRDHTEFPNTCICSGILLFPLYRFFPYPLGLDK